MARAARFTNRIDIVVFVLCLIFAGVVLALPAQAREPMAGSLRRSVVAPLVGLQEGAERWRAAWLESETRREHRDSLALQSMDRQAAEGENAHLRRLLGLGARLQWGFVAAEALHNTGREDVLTTIALTAGANAGVRRYSPVVAPEGIVGLVQTADPALSVAILFSHPDFRASAMSSDGSAYGIVYPHLGSSSRPYLLELRGVPYRAQLKPGAQILTSGLGGSFPKGIPIGTVISELRTAEGWTRTYLLQPAVNPPNITAVMVLLPQRVSQGVGNVWTNTAQVDSAAKRIAAAGDSLAREEALAEAAARRAAFDSAQRAAGIVPGAPSPDSIRPDTTAGRVPPAAPVTRPPAATAPVTRPQPTTPRPATPVRRDSTARPVTHIDTTRPALRRGLP